LDCATIVFVIQAFDELLGFPEVGAGHIVEHGTEKTINAVVVASEALQRAFSASGTGAKEFKVDFGHGYLL
jgi:glutamate/tyrosine decarboxylase-like PLP-dependent enzyme